MNGSIENFNWWFEEKFWAKEAFTNLEDMRAKQTHFVGQYNDLSAWKKRNKSLEQINPTKILNKSLKISVLNEAFKVGEEFIGEYVWATICLEKQTMEVFYRAKDQDTAVLIEKFEYEPSQVVHDLRPDIGKTS